MTPETERGFGIGYLLEMNELVAGKNWQALAAHPQIYREKDWAMELAEKGDQNTRLALAANENLDKMPEVAVKLVMRNNEVILDRLITNSAISQLDEVLAVLANTPNIKIRKTIASSTLTENKIIGDRIAGDTNLEVRKTLASSCYISNYPGYAMKLAKDPHIEVRLALARNPIVRELPEVISVLKNDEHQTVAMSAKKTEAGIREVSPKRYPSAIFIDM